MIRCNRDWSQKDTTMRRRIAIVCSENLYRASAMYLVTLVCVPLAALAWSQEARQDKESGELTSLRKQIDESIHWFKLSTVGTDAVALEPLAALRWDNNQRGSELGLTVLYLGSGRPEAVCCIYPWQRQLVHEFSSLSRGPIKATRNGEDVWHPDKPGVEFRLIPDLPTPQESPAARLRQMKALADRFRARLLGWKGDNSDRQELRMLPRPIYRYEKPAGVVTDGAVFAFAMGVDPEALLLIEAVSAAEGRRWEYAFVRRTSGELEGRLDDNVVWTAQRFPRTNDPTGLIRTFAKPLNSLEAPALDPRTTLP